MIRQALEAGSCDRVPGGAEGDRTPDLVVANDALSQLSYDPLGKISGLAP